MAKGIHTQSKELGWVKGRSLRVSQGVHTIRATWAGQDMKQQVKIDEPYHMYPLSHFLSPALVTVWKIVQFKR